MNHVLWYGWGGGDDQKVEAKVSFKHPNDTITFQITDVSFLERTGWKPTSFVEVQASPKVGDGPVPRDKYVWTVSP